MAEKNRIVFLPVCCLSSPRVPASVSTGAFLCPAYHITVAIIALDVVGVEMQDEVPIQKQHYVGECIRLEIPLKSVMNLRRVAEELRGLASRLECLSRYQSESASVTMLMARSEIKRSADRITAIRGRGRPKRSRHKF